MTKKDWAVSLIAFIVIQAMICFLAWVGGFNFDERSPDIALAAFYSMFIGGIMAYLVSLILRGK